MSEAKPDHDKISDDIKANDVEESNDAGSAGSQQGNGPLPRKPEGPKLTVPAGTQGEASLYYNPKYPNGPSRVGESVGSNIKSKRKSWADAAREDDMMRGDYYENYLEQMAEINGDDTLIEMIRNNPDMAQKVFMADEAANVGRTGGSGATEEEKAARRERIRARREERIRNGEGENFDDAGDTSKYYRTADGTIKKLPGLAREEFLESIKEGGVPIMSWLIIALAMGIGTYQLRKVIRQPEAKGNRRKGGDIRAASPAKTRAANKVKMGKMNRPSAAAPEALEPELDFELDPEPKRGPKHPKKNKSSKKKRVRKPIANSNADNTETDSSISSDAIGNGTKPSARSSVGMENTTSKVLSDDTGSDELELTSYNEDDRLAIIQVLSEGGGDGANAAAIEDDDGWVTAGRKSKGAKKQLSPEKLPPAEGAKAIVDPSTEGTEVIQEETSMAPEDKESSPTNDSKSGPINLDASCGSKEKKTPTNDPKAAPPKSKVTLPKSESAPSTPSKVNPKGPTAQSPPEPIDTKEEDAKLAQKLQKQEENMAAREMGMDVEEEWEEVSPKKKGRKANLAHSSTAIAPAS